MANEQPADIVCLARVTNAQQAHVWRVALEAEGIYCRVVGDYLDAGFGSLDAIPAELWVRRPDLERARATLAALQAQSPDEPADEEE